MQAHQAYMKQLSESRTHICGICGKGFNHEKHLMDHHKLQVWTKRISKLSSISLVTVYFS